jgi:hypothetical protein
MMSKMKTLQSLFALSLLAALASGCLGKESSSGGGSANTTVACKETTYETCVEYTYAGPIAGDCGADPGTVSMGSSCGGLKNTALSSCSTSNSGVGMVTYYQPAFYLYLKDSNSLSCDAVKQSFESGCSTASGAFADLGGSHSAYQCP